MINRIDNGVRIQITCPGEEVPSIVTVTGTQKAYSPDHLIAIGGFFDRTHYIVGGYSLLYLHTI